MTTRLQGLSQTVRSIESAIHLKLLTLIALLSLLTAIVRLTMIQRDPGPTVVLMLLIPFVLFCLRILLWQHLTAKDNPHVLGPPVSLLGFSSAALFLVLNPILEHQHLHLALLTVGVTSLLLPGFLLLPLLLLASLCWIPAYWLAVPLSYWVYWMIGLLISASARFSWESFHYGFQAKMQNLRDRLQREQEVADWLHESKLRYENLFRSSKDVILELNSEGTVTSINPIFEKVTGWASEDQVGKPFTALVFPDDIPLCQEGLSKSMRSTGHLHIEARLNSKLGEPRLVDLQFIAHQVADNQYRIGDITIIARDITDARRIQETLSETQERFALVAQGANGGLWDWDIRSEQIYLSPRWKYMLGYEDDEIGTSPTEWFDRVHPQDLQRVEAALQSHMDGDSPHFESTFRIRHKNGAHLWVSSRGIAVRDPSGEASRMVGSQADITHFKVTEEQLQHDAFHDALTGLANRTLFVERLEDAIQRAQKDSVFSFAVLFLDLDRFKEINDRLGHQTGDQLLAAVARRISSCARTHDTVARLGGDEFTLLLKDIQHTNDAGQIAERIQRALNAPFHVDGQEVHTTASIGIALSRAGYQRPADVLRDADFAMYRAKIMGKARHEVFDPGVQARADKLLRLESDLRQAVEQQEFRVHFQPIVHLKEGVVRGFEALVRWQHPQKGVLPASAFVNVAEETGVIIPIGWQVLEEACTQVQKWQSQLQLDPPLTVSVNLSSKNLSQPEIVEQVERAIQSSGIRPTSLKLEITENALMDDAIIEPLSQLKELGVHLHLDNFGSGYSSLGYLHRFPLDASKIDRSFIQAMMRDSESARIVQTMIALSHSLGMEVIATGVENVEQAARLRSLGCDYVQGHLYSMPVSPETAEKLMSRLLSPEASPTNAL